jgi:hypothetical protein
MTHGARRHHDAQPLPAVCCFTKLPRNCVAWPRAAAEPAPATGARRCVPPGPGVGFVGSIKKALPAISLKNDSQSARSPSRCCRNPAGLRRHAVAARTCRPSCFRPRPPGRHWIIAAEQTWIHCSLAPKGWRSTGITVCRTLTLSPVFDRRH